MNTTIKQGASWLFVAALGVFLFAPVAVVVLFAFNGIDSNNRFEGLSLRWFRVIFDDQSFRSAFANTLWSAAATVIVTEALALPAALMLVRVGVRARNALRAVFSLPIILPGLIIGTALIIMLSSLSIQLGLATVVLGHVLVTFPIVLVILIARLERMDMAVLAAARDLGAGRLVAARRVLLPLILPSMAGAGLIAAAWSIDEFIITLFTNGGAVTIPVYLYSQIVKHGPTPGFNAAAVLLIAVNTLAIIAAARFVRFSDLR